MTRAAGIDPHGPGRYLPSWNGLSLQDRNGVRQVFEVGERALEGVMSHGARRCDVVAFTSSFGGYSVDDVGAATEFYTNTLGLEVNALVGRECSPLYMSNLTRCPTSPASCDRSRPYAAQANSRLKRRIS